MAEQRRAFDGVVAALERHGLLLQQDKTLPNVVTMVAGETLSGSWWNHRRSDAIFECLTRLAEHDDITFAKLIAGKVTLVHRRHWPALLGVATSNEAWQTEALAPQAETLLADVRRLGELNASGAAARELERRLLAHGEQIHTAAGHHELHLETWSLWSRRGGGVEPLDSITGRVILEEAVISLGGRHTLLPWRRKR